MTAAMDFASMPPEINSARMYSGPGSDPMLAAASAWKGLAAELRVTAMSYGSVLAALTGEEWYGPASASMAAAATPYVAWMSTTAVQAEQTGVQAEAAAAAYEVAFAATVPPAAIAANRAQLLTLIATNVLGQNSPAIAATEALYAEMWAQDAMAMYAYAGSCAVATRLSEFVQPMQANNPSRLVAQAAAVTQASGQAAGTQQSTLAQLISAVPSILAGLASSNSSSSGPVGLLSSLLAGDGTSWLEKLWEEFGPNANIWNTLASTGFLLPSNMVTPFLGMLGGAAVADAADDAVVAGTGGLGGALTHPLASTGGMGGGLAAAAGNAAAVGKLSVPPSWIAGAPLPNPLGSALGGTPMVAPPPAGAAGLPGVPFASMTGQPFGRAVPQYGFRPSFVARPPAAG
ncbi:putative PPE family protein PPE29 [Mycobacterium basiliense]|uniref:Putative PPE family protein PPE29 n=1 Tax=Mycobacterium basiliense TaxID=2094119 RepID=A0A447GEJ2_9MYCO|nr:PPE family protein [Mycobacterium basiliense]VDM88911.1 putative PPE family protein PPE29 [Mycobacterium basiliense]